MGQLAMKFPGIRVIAEDDVFEPVRSNFRCRGSKVKGDTVLSKSKEFLNKMASVPTRGMGASGELKFLKTNK